MQTRQWILLFCIWVLVGAIGFMSLKSPSQLSPDINLTTQSTPDSTEQANTLPEQAGAQEEARLATDPKLTAGDTKSYTNCSDNTQIPESECDALVALYTMTAGETWKKKEHWLSNLSPCSWYGVTCDAGHIVAIDLSNNGLVGPLPDQIWDLTMLRDLTLADNQLNGAIPDAIGGCKALVNLVLSRNALTDQLPTSLYSIKSLQNIAVARNQLTGKISPAISALQNLRTLSVANNAFSGPLPETLGDLPALSWIVLDHNGFCGQLPESLQELPIEDKIDLTNNKFIMEGNSPALQTWIDEHIDRGMQESASCV